MLHRIKNINGEWKETIANIQGIIVDYFSRFFTTSRDGTSSERDMMQRVQESDKEGLIREITEKDVKCYIFDASGQITGSLSSMGGRGGHEPLDRWGAGVFCDC